MKTIKPRISLVIRHDFKPEYREHSIDFQVVNANTMRPARKNTKQKLLIFYRIANKSTLDQLTHDRAMRRILKPKVKEITPFPL